jgi:hypothetical protein
MDRCDAEQEGVTLPPVSMSRLIARQEANEAIIEHIGLCSFNKSQVEQRVRTLEMGYARLTGFMVGSGILGGASAAIVTKCFGG